MILVIDNYDSFTFNLVQYLGVLKQNVTVVRNDATTLAAIEQMNPGALLISPGPGRPENSGIIVDVIRHFAGRLPILGVCLGLQAIGFAFGGRVIPAPTLMHGKTSDIYHDGRTLFSGIPNPFIATRYHSLVVDGEDLPDCLEISARTSDHIVMGLRHRTQAVEGVQFHPESILTEKGIMLLENFVQSAEGARR